jgi:hypothetical protein
MTTPVETPPARTDRIASRNRERIGVSSEQVAEANDGRLGVVPQGFGPALVMTLSSLVMLTPSATMVRLRLLGNAVKELVEQLVRQRPRLLPGAALPIRSPTQGQDQEAQI